MPRRAAIAVLIAAGACAGGGADSPDTTAPAATTLLVDITTTSVAETAPTTSAVPALPATEPRRPLVDLLGRIPDTGNHRDSVAIWDFELARRQAGVPEFTELDSGSDALRDQHKWFIPWSTLDPRGLEVDAWEEEFGFSLLDIDQEVMAGHSPRLAVWYFGSMSPEAIHEATAQDPTWSSRLTIAEGPGFVLYDWGTGPSDLTLASAARPRGNPGQLAVLDGAVVRTTSLEAMVEAIADTPALVEVPSLRACAETLSDAGAAWIRISTVTYGASRSNPEGEQRANLFLAEWEAAGVGLRIGPDGTGWGFVVLAHDSEAAALENSERLRNDVTTGSTAHGNPYAELVQAPVVTVDGSTVLLRFTADQWRSLVPLLSGVLDGASDLLAIETA